MYKTLQELKAHYQQIRNHPCVNLYEDQAGYIAIWNPQTRLYDWFRYDQERGGYIQTGSTEKRGNTTRINLPMF